MRHLRPPATTFIVLLLCLGAWSPTQAAKGDADKVAVAVTAADPAIPLDELDLMLEPMRKDELFAEADAWLDLLQKQVRKLTQRELEIKRKNKQIEAAEVKAKEAEEEAEEAEQEVKEANGSGKAAHEERAKAASAEKEQKVAEVEQGKAEEVAQEKAERKTEMLDELAVLRDERTALIDRLNVVLDAIDEKIGKTDKGLEKEEVMPYRRYINAVSGIKVDVSDVQATWSSASGWLLSDEGGIRWGKNIASFVLTVVVFWFLGRILGRMMGRALSFTAGTSVIMRDFLIQSVRRITIIIGILIGLAALEVNIGPLLAVIGAAGFVVAFALQDTLGNFASGLMIMFYRPFDVGDVVDVAGISGKVLRMSLVNTTITTFDNKVTVVPNSSIWGNVIINATGSDERRVDMTFGIGYDDDIDQTKQILEDIVTSHALVLKEPAPVVQMHEMADSSINFICRPWAKTADYWSVYWDVMREVKRRFDAQGISIPYPQRDVHIYNETAAAVSAGPVESAVKETKPPGKQDIDRSGLDDEDGQPVRSSADD